MMMMMMMMMVMMMVGKEAEDELDNDGTPSLDLCAMVETEVRQAEARARKTGFGKRAEAMITAAAVHDPRSPEALLRQQECLERLHNACEQGLIAPNLLTAYAGTPHQVAQRRAFLKRKDPD